jgi:thiamine pyrophosphokinase
MKYLIVANNGLELPKLKFFSGRKIIALDGAANRLVEQNIIPDFTIGDLDSLSLSVRRWLLENGKEVIESDDQDSTDLEKGILFADKKGAEDIIICNCLGGMRLDHSIFNLRVLKKYHDERRRLRVLYEGSFAEYYPDKIIKVKGVKFDPIAVMSFPKATISSKGLRYEMKEYPIEFGDKESACNEIMSENGECEISIKGEAVIISNVAAEVLFS